MALITATTILTSLSLFHLTLAYYFLTSPSTIADHNLVYIIGEAMGLPHATTLLTHSAPTSFLSAILALLALSDLTAASLHAEVFSFYWSSQAPIRLAFFFGVTGWSYYSGSTGRGSSIGHTASAVSGEGPAAEALGNSMVFTWGFVELLCWFWIYITLRDERRELVTKAAERRRGEEDLL